MNKKDKSILFVLPGTARALTGGYKVIYEYANRFSAEGWTVGLLYSYPPRKKGIKNYIKQILKKVMYDIFKTYKTCKWFPLNKNINKYLLANEILDNFPVECKSYEYICATALKTSFWVKEWGFFDEQKKLYLIQGFENWNGIKDDIVFSSYKLGLKNIAISEWLKNIVEGCGEKCYLVNNGFDFNSFKLISPIESRNPCTIVMLYHTSPLKGISYSFSALETLKKDFPELEVNIYGVPKRPKSLPSWYHYVQKPSKKELLDLYNSSSIFISSSIQEGWGLTVGEAMLCGCAVACTENNGHLIMAKNEITALTSPIRNSSLLAENIKKLITNNKLRIEIAKKGNEFIQKFDWDSSFTEFLRVIQENE